MINSARERTTENWPNNRAAVIKSLTKSSAARTRTKASLRTCTSAKGEVRPTKTVIANTAKSTATTMSAKRRWLGVGSSFASANSVSCAALKANEASAHKYRDVSQALHSHR